MVARILSEAPAAARVDALLSVQTADAADENRVPAAHWALSSVDLTRSDRRLEEVRGIAEFAASLVEDLEEEPGPGSKPLERPLGYSAISEMLDEHIESREKAERTLTALIAACNPEVTSKLEAELDDLEREAAVAADQADIELRAMQEHLDRLEAETSDDDDDEPAALRTPQAAERAGSPAADEEPTETGAGPTLFKTVASSARITVGFDSPSEAAEGAEAAAAAAEEAVAGEGAAKEEEEAPVRLRRESTRRLSTRPLHGKSSKSKRLAEEAEAAAAAKVKLELDLARAHAALLKARDQLAAYKIGSQTRMLKLGVPDGMRLPGARLADCGTQTGPMHEAAVKSSLHKLLHEKTAIAIELEEKIEKLEGRLAVVDDEHNAAVARLRRPKKLLPNGKEAPKKYLAQHLEGRFLDMGTQTTGDVDSYVAKLVAENKRLKELGGGGGGGDDAVEMERRFEAEKSKLVAQNERLQKQVDDLSSSDHGRMLAQQQQRVERMRSYGIELLGALPRHLYAMQRADAEAAFELSASDLATIEAKHSKQPVGNYSPFANGGGGGSEREEELTLEVTRLEGALERESWQVVAAVLDGLVGQVAEREAADIDFRAYREAAESKEALAVFRAVCVAEEVAEATAKAEAERYAEEARQAAAAAEEDAVARVQKGIDEANMKNAIVIRELERELEAAHGAAADAIVAMEEATERAVTAEAYIVEVEAKLANAVDEAAKAAAELQAKLRLSAATGASLLRSLTDADGDLWRALRVAAQVEGLKAELERVKAEAAAAAANLTAERDAALGRAAEAETKIEALESFLEAARAIAREAETATEMARTEGYAAASALAAELSCIEQLEMGLLRDAVAAAEAEAAKALALLKEVQGRAKSDKLASRFVAAAKVGAAGAAAERAHVDLISERDNLRCGQACLLAELPALDETVAAQAAALQAAEGRCTELRATVEALQAEVAQMAAQASEAPSVPPPPPAVWEEPWRTEVKPNAPAWEILASDPDAAEDADVKPPERTSERPPEARPSPVRAPSNRALQRKLTSQAVKTSTALPRSVKEDEAEASDRSSPDAAAPEGAVGDGGAKRRGWANAPPPSGADDTAPVRQRPRSNSVLECSTSAVRKASLAAGEAAADVDAALEQRREALDRQEFTLQHRERVLQLREAECREAEDELKRLRGLAADEREAVERPSTVAGGRATPSSAATGRATTSTPRSRGRGPGPAAGSPGAAFSTKQGFDGNGFRGTRSQMLAHTGQGIIDSLGAKLGGGAAEAAGILLAEGRLDKALESATSFEQLRSIASVLGRQMAELEEQNRKLLSLQGTRVGTPVAAAGPGAEGSPHSRPEGEWGRKHAENLLRLGYEAQVGQQAESRGSEPQSAPLSAPSGGPSSRLGPRGETHFPLGPASASPSRADSRGAAGFGSGFGSVGASAGASGRSTSVGRKRAADERVAEAPAEEGRAQAHLGEGDIDGAEIGSDIWDEMAPGDADRLGGSPYASPLRLSASMGSLGNVGNGRLPPMRAPTPTAALRGPTPTTTRLLSTGAVSPSQLLEESQRTLRRQQGSGAHQQANLAAAYGAFGSSPHFGGSMPSPSPYAGQAWPIESMQTVPRTRSRPGDAYAHEEAQPASRPTGAITGSVARGKPPRPPPKPLAHKNVTYGLQATGAGQAVRPM